MAWRNVIITQHAKLSYSSHMMVVQTMSGIKQIPISDINTLLIDTEQAVITSALICKLSKEQVKVVFTDDKKQPVCEMVSNAPNNRSAELLNTQFSWDEDRKELLWTKIVMSKIENQIQVIKSIGEDSDLLEYELNRIEFNDRSNREAVVARKYFPMLFEDSKFNRHDRETPINAVLNYGYSILLSSVNKKIVSDGYLTFLGIHHHSDNNMFNLGSDLMEPFRPIIDLWVAQHQFKALTPDIKYGMVSLLNLEVNFNGKNTLLMNAIDSHVHSCLIYLNNERNSIDMEMGFSDEVSNHATNGHV